MDKVKNSYPLADLLDRDSLEFLKNLTGKDYRKESRKKEKTIRVKKSISTFQLKVLMEEMPKGELYGR